MADKDTYSFDLGAPGTQPEPFTMTPAEIAETLKTIPPETLENYGIDLEGTDTPEQAITEGKVYAFNILGDETGIATRMVREGYIITDRADYYWFGHRKWSGRGGKKPGFIIPHHMAGNLTPAQFYAIMASSRQMSATVSVHTDGTVYAWVPEEMRPWTTGSYTADQDALTLEIANDEIGGSWHISDKAYDTAVAIMAEWCKRYGIDPVWKPGLMGTIQMHKEWAATSCPGPYLSGIITSGKLERDIKAAMNPKPPTPTPKPGTVKYRVQAGAFKSSANADNLINKIQAAGYQAVKIAQGGLYRVQCGVFMSKANAEAYAMKLRGAGFPTAIITIK